MYEAYNSFCIHVIDGAQNPACALAAYEKNRTNIKYYDPVLKNIQIKRADLLERYEHKNSSHPHMGEQCPFDDCMHSPADNTGSDIQFEARECTFKQLS